MKKISKNQQIIIVVCVFVGLLVGSFFAFLYYVYFYDFCPNPEDHVPISVGCVMRFPEKYADQYVIVVGEYVSDSRQWSVQSSHGTYTVNVSGRIRGGSARFGDVPVSLPFTFVNETNISNLTPGDEYKWIGTFRYTGRASYGSGESYLTWMFLEVSLVEST